MRVTPTEAWRAMRAPFLAAIDAAEAQVRAAADDAAADYNIACGVRRSAIDAHKTFYRRNPQPQKSAQWRDYRHDDPLVKLIFGERK